MKGVINLRGKVIPVIDLRLKFSMQEENHTQDTCVIVVEFNNTSIGIILIAYQRCQTSAVER